MERYLTNDLKPMNNGVRNIMEKYAAVRIALKFLGVLGVSMVMVCWLEILTHSILTSNS
jgi:KUP system potassium uptake protein